jgi:hypothetical protein
MKHELIAVPIEGKVLAAPKLEIGGHPWTLQVQQVWGEPVATPDNSWSTLLSSPDWLNPEEISAGLLTWHRQILKTQNENRLQTCVEVLVLRQQGDRMLFASVGRARIFCYSQNRWWAVEAGFGWEDLSTQQKDPLPRSVLGLPSAPQVRWGVLPLRGVEQFLIWSGRQPSASLWGREVIDSAAVMQEWLVDPSAVPGWAMLLAP